VKEERAKKETDTPSQVPQLSAEVLRNSIVIK
jgi:hypothetical protein